MHAWRPSHELPFSPCIGFELAFRGDEGTRYRRGDFAKRPRRKKCSLFSAAHAPRRPQVAFTRSLLGLRAVDFVLLLYDDYEYRARFR